MLIQLSQSQRREQEMSELNRMTIPMIIIPQLYKLAKRAGYDMTGYVKTRKIRWYHRFGNWHREFHLTGELAGDLVAPAVETRK